MIFDYVLLTKTKTSLFHFIIYIYNVIQVHVYKNFDLSKLMYQLLKWELTWNTRSEDYPPTPLPLPILDSWWATLNLSILLFKISLLHVCTCIYTLMGYYAHGGFSVNICYHLQTCIHGHLSNLKWVYACIHLFEKIE